MNYSPEQQAFIDARILQAKRELLRSWWGADIIESRHGNALPLTVDSFSQLHDYCDANELGGLCDDAVTDEGNRLFPEREDDSTLATQEWMDACNHIQDAIHAWLETRASVDDFAFIVRWLDFEQVDCLLDDERAEEARGMVDEDIGNRMSHLFPAETVARLRTFLLPVD